jgi:hypothetical protein
MGAAVFVSETTDFLVPLAVAFAFEEGATTAESSFLATLLAGSEISFTIHWEAGRFGIFVDVYLDSLRPDPISASLHTAKRANSHLKPHEPALQTCLLSAYRFVTDTDTSARSITASEQPRRHAFRPRNPGQIDTNRASSQ